MGVDETVDDSKINVREIASDKAEVSIGLDPQDRRGDVSIRGRLRWLHRS